MTHAAGSRALHAHYTWQSAVVIERGHPALEEGTTGTASDLGGPTTVDQHDTSDELEFHEHLLFLKH